MCGEFLIIGIVAGQVSVGLAIALAWYHTHPQNA